MGDGKTFEQAVRALDKLIAEQLRAAEAAEVAEASDDPVRREYEQTVGIAVAPAR